MNGYILQSNPEAMAHLKRLFLVDGLLQVMPAEILKYIPQTHLALFAHEYGFYSFPTLELAEWLKTNFDLSSAIEIGAGHGALARFLGIPPTDAMITNRKDISLYYKIYGQNVIEYPPDIICMDARIAIEHYHPSVVIGCWVTCKYRPDEHKAGGSIFGIDEDWILDNVKKYILVGNEKVHSNKRILRRPHKTYKFPWLFSRSMSPDENVIYVWGD